MSSFSNSTIKPTLWYDVRDSAIGIIMLLLPIFLIRKVNHKMHSLRNPDNVTLNVLNMHLYRSMRAALLVQICTNVYIPVAQILNNYEQGMEGKWISFFFIGVCHYMRILFDIMWINYQVYEWVSISAMIRWESCLDYELLTDKLR